MNADPPLLPDLNWWLEERERVFRLCRADSTYRQAFIEQCKEDPIFWLQYTAWAFDPRKLGDDVIQPLIPWQYQEEFVTKLVGILNRARADFLYEESIVIDKARDMGASFCTLLVFQWFWQFHDTSFIIGSRKEEEVDKAGDMDTPFEKLRFQIRRQPDFLLPPGFDIDSKRFSKELIISSKPPGMGGAQIVGESANPDFGRGGRALAAFCDEFQKWPFDEASWRSLSGTVKVRIALGTPDGPFSKFATLINGDAQGRLPQKREHIRLHWWLHPERAIGLEERNGQKWSPWLQMKSEAVDSETLAKEYLLDYNTSTKGIIMDTFNESIHVDETLEIDEKADTLCVLDPGITFGVTWHQRDDDGTYKQFYELLLEEAHLDEVGSAIHEINSKHFPGINVEYIGDPQGASRLVPGQVQADYVTLQRKHGIQVHSIWLARIQAQQREKARITALRMKLDERIPGTGKPGLLIHPRCAVTIQAFKGGYRRMVDKSGQVLETVDRRHPWCDAMDCTGMGAMYWYLIRTGKLRALNVKKQSVEEKRWRKPGRNRGWGG